MKCTDCIHFECCQAINKEFEEKMTISNIEDHCCLFKNNRKFLNLHLSRGDYFYYVDDQKIICNRVEDVRIGYIPRFSMGSNHEKIYGINDQLFGDLLFLSKEEADKRICSKSI